ncbi:hypothetical protein [Streptomyces nigrescens]|uniref:hypothetical protein n=1 Tax=Streptomyces nigrescens TaxID=1920 RepID=UPI003700B1B5
MTGTDSLIPPGTPSVLGAAPGVTEDAGAYVAAGGYRRAIGAAELLDRIDGLRGRGGAGLETAVVRRINGGPALPTANRPAPTSRASAAHRPSSPTSRPWPVSRSSPHSRTVGAARPAPPW